MENWNWTNFCGKDGFYIWSPTQNDFGVCFQSLFLHIPILSIFGVISAYYLGLERSYISRTVVQNYSLIIRSIISVILAFTPILEIFLKISLNEHKAGAASLLLLIIQGICWFVHFLYVLRLKKGISKNPRGPMLICIVWSFLFALNLLATRSQFIIYKNTDIESEIFGYNIIILHIGYALTMIPGITEENRIIESEYTSLINSSVRFELDNDSRYLGEALEREKCFSRIFFTWVNALIHKGAEDGINNSDDLFDLPNSISTKYNSVKLGQYLNDNNESTNQKYSLIKALHKAYACEFYSVGILKFIADCCGFAGPILLNKLVTFIENKSEDMIYGYLYALGLIFSTAIAALCDTHFNFLVSVVGLKMRGAIITTIYKKTLLIRSTILSSYLSFGEIVNFMSTDTDRIVNACPSFHSLWSVPFQIIVTLYLLYQQVGIAFLAGLIFSIILIPVNKIIANKIGELSTKMMKYKDERVKLTSEVLLGYKAIKLYVWEEHFIREITKKRDIELKYLKGRKYLDALCVYFWATTPVIISILTIGTYVLLGNKLTAAGIFTTIALLNMLVSPLNAFPWVLNGLTEAWVSIKRIQKLLNLNSINYNEIYNNSINNDNSNNDIIIKNGLFSWENKNNERRFELNNINFEIKQGEFIAVIGPVGSGKSTFLASILGELKTESGDIGLKEISSGFGIVTQQPWLQRGNIRDNILFGKPYNESKYNSIIFSCGLEEDIKNLPEGDLTVIGDGGGTLSGGQKTRIALARAVYQDKNIYLFDDILSAVDIKVAKHIFQYCLLDLLKNKTRILCTHHLKYLNNVDKIVVLENGLLKVTGVPGEILDNDLFLIENTDNISEKIHTDEINFINNKTEDNDFMDEKSERGNLKFSVYISYWKSIGTTISIFIILSMIFMQLSRNLTDWWLASQLTAQERNSTKLTNFILINSDNENMKLFLLVYIGFAVSNTIFTLIRAFIFAYGGVTAAKKLHKSLLRTVLKGISKFFYFTPTGTIINRFSSDTYTIDDSLPFILNILLAQMFGLLGCICITVYGLPWICIVLIPMVPIYTWLMNQYRITSRELKRISSVTLSPVYNHFNETLQGLINIRAMRAMNRFQIENEDKVEANLKAQFASQSAARWLGLRLQFISVAIITGVSVIAVIQHQYQVANPGFIGLAISYALSITGSLAGVVNAFTETEREMISVERVKQYIEIVPCETEFFIMDPPFAWPTLSVIKFENVVLHYRKNSNPCLNNISFETRPSEKIGIVGRTGAGKSSILTALFRLVDLSSGSIYVDNIDIKKLSIKALRSRLFCIPQDPFLFSGTIRENLDPLNEFSDVEINDTLKRFKLIEILNNLGGLECVINGSGTNLSVGQKQLICLCRAVLRNPRILCIDEATANVDEETDKIIQSTLRIAFSTSTVLTIAHRIQTVYDSDRVLVINHGQIMEFDKPDILLANPDSYFCKLVKEI